jgi:hypothetical protein
MGHCYTLNNQIRNTVLGNKLNIFNAMIKFIVTDLIGPVM